jgi:two-component system nitrogen regulation response regulator GlnG
LENAIKRAVILSSDPHLSVDDFSGLRSNISSPSRNEELSLEALVEMKLRSSLGNLENMESGDLYGLILEQMERPLIRFVLEKTRGNQVKAAEILGITGIPCERRFRNST